MCDNSSIDFNAWSTSPISYPIQVVINAIHATGAAVESTM